MECQFSTQPLGKRSATHLPVEATTRYQRINERSTVPCLKSPSLTSSQRALLNTLHRELALSFEKTKIQILTTRQIEILEFTKRPHFIFPGIEEGSHPLTKLFEEVFVEVNTLRACAGVSVSPQYPIYFCKDELLSNLRAHLAFFVQSHESLLSDSSKRDSEIVAAKIARYYSWIRELGELNDFYLTRQSLPEDFPQTILRSAKRFVSSSAVLLLSGSDAYENVKQFFNLRYRADLRSYYVKSDLETPCEMKAQQILAELTRGFNNFHRLYQAKFRADFGHGRIGREDLGICAVSREVVAAREDFYLFDRYNEAFLKFRASQFRNSQELNRHQAQLAREDALFESHGKFSLPFHVLMDLVFLSCDSHAGQYVPISDKLLNIEYVNIDFSRILPDSEVKIDKDGQVYSLFRSAYLFAPHCLKPMAPELVALINSWNIESIRQALQPLVGSQQEFLRQKQAFRSTYAKGHIQEAYRTIAHNCYSKIHPHSFELFVDRLVKTKEYVKTTPQPSVYGVFVYLYPDLAAIMTVLTRRISHPSELVGSNKDDPQYFGEEDDLKPIISKPIARYLDKIKRDRLATPDEWNLLMWHYENLKRKAISTEDVIQFFAST